MSPLCTSLEPFAHHAPAHRLQPSRGQQLHRAVPSQLERRGGVAQRISELRPGEVEHLALDRGVQSRPSASRTPRTNPARRSCSLRSNHHFKHGPSCLVLEGALPFLGFSTGHVARKDPSDDAERKSVRTSNWAEDRRYRQQRTCNASRVSPLLADTN